MTDSERSKSNDKILQENSSSDENYRNDGNNNADGEDVDVESGIGTLNEYDTVVNVESTEVGSSSGTWNNNDYGEGIRVGSIEEKNQQNVLVNMEPKASRLHTEGDILNQSSDRNTGLRRHTFAGSKRGNFDEDDYPPESNASRLSCEEMEQGKSSINFELKGSRRYTEGDVLHQVSERNAGLRRHTYAGSKRGNFDEDDYQPESNVSKLSSEEMERGKSSMNFEPRGSRRYTEGDVLNQSSEKNAGQRRHTFAGSRLDNIEEDDYQPVSNVSKLSSKEKEQGKGSLNFEPRGSRRHTEGNILNQSSERNTGQRRQTFAGSRLDNIEEDDIQAQTNARRLSKSFSDTRIDVLRNFCEGDRSFPSQNRNISRRITIAGDIVEGLRELLGKTVEEDNGNTSRFSNKGKRHSTADIHARGKPVLPLKDDIRELQPGTLDDVISSSEDEQNLRRIRDQYEAFKRHTIAGDRSEYKHGRSPSRGWFTSDETGPEIKPDNRQPNAPNSVILKRHTIAGTGSKDIDDLIDRDELRALQNLARSSERRKYSEDRRQPRRTSTIHRGNVDETQDDGVIDFIPTPLKRNSVSGQEYIRDVILDKDEDIRIDRLPRGSSLLRRHTVHSGRQDGHFGATAVDPERRTRRRATHSNFTQDHDFTLHGDLKDKQSRTRRESDPVGRRNTERDVGHGVDELPLKNERQQDHSTDRVSTRIHPVSGHPFQYRDSVDAEEDVLRQNLQGFAKAVARNENCDRYNDVHPGEDGQIYYIYSDNETDRHYIPQTPRNSSRYILSDNELHIHQDDAPRGTNIIVNDTNPTNSMKIQTPRFTITRSGQDADELQHHGQKSLIYHGNEMDLTHGGTRVHHEEVVKSQQSRDLNTGTVSSDYFVLRSSVTPSTEGIINEAGPQSGMQMIPARNILLRGQDEQGNKLKFNLSVIEEEGDEEYYRELEMQSQETSNDHVSTQQFVHRCNDQKHVTVTKSPKGESDISKNTSKLLESQEHVQQPSTSVVISKHGVTINNQRRQVSMSRRMEPVPDGKCLCSPARALEQIACEKCNPDNTSVTVEQRDDIRNRNIQRLKEDDSGTKGKQQVVDSNHENNLCHNTCCKPRTSTEATDGEGNEILRQKRQRKENNKSVLISEETDQMKTNGKSAISKYSQLHRKEPDGRSHKTDGNLCLPCCSLHGKYQLHHPVCCWHMTNNQYDECKAKQSRKVIGELEETDHTNASETTESGVKGIDLLLETSQTSESLAEETGQKFSDPARETKYIISKSEQQKACLNCIHDLQETRQKSDCEVQDVCPECAGLQIVTGSKHESQTLETRMEKSENIQGKLQDSRPKRDTSSERGEYKTAEETSVSEVDYNDTKVDSDEGSSNCHRKKRRHRKSYKTTSRRKGSLDRRRGSPIRLSPIKTAAYDRIVKQNKEMSDYLAKLTDEKSELRSTLCNLELQISEYRDREANHVESMRRNKHEMEAILTTERNRAAQDRLTLHQKIEGQNRQLNDVRNKLREREIEMDKTKRSLQLMEDQVERYKVSAKRLQSPESFVPHWTPTRIQKLYARYIRAEKSRKSLVYQKKYLVLLLGGFRENETRTLAMIAKMGAYPSYHEPTSRFSPAFTKFRTAVRVVVATKRMQFLVAKSKKSVRQVMEQVESKSSSHRNTQSSTKSVNNDRQYDLSRPNYRQSNAYQSVPSRFEADDVNGYSSQPSDFSTDPKDTSFAEIYTGSIETAVPKHTDSGVYSAFDFKPTEMVTRGTNRGRPNSDLTNRLGSYNVHSMPHSPPVRERPNSQGSQHSSIRPPFSAYPHQTDPRRSARTALHFDSEDLDRKIQTLDNLQQKLSLNRGSMDKDR